MVADPLSPIAPARVRALLLPIGKIKRARFLSFVERLQPENVVRLGDISPDGRPNRNMFSPLAFGSGMIVYELSTSIPPVSQLTLFPFELHREPLAIIAIADGNELGPGNKSKQNGDSNGNRPLSYHGYIRELDQELEAVRDQYPKALVHQLFIFDYKNPPGGTNLPDGLVAIPPVAECKTTTMKTVMCDFSSMLLAEMTTLARSLQGRSMIESPNQARAASQNNGYSWSASEELSRRASVYSPTDRTESPSIKDIKNAVRMSMPAALRRTPSGVSKSDSNSRPTTPNGQDTPEPKSPDNGPLSRAKNESYRDPSRDRISVQGFGSGSPNEMSRNKAKGRAGVVLGSMYLQAGRWNDALRECVEGAQLARNSGDHLWHAKGLEIIMVSMLMIAWAGLDFQIPQICYTSTDKTPYQFNPGATSDSGLTSNRLVALSNLAFLLPELLSKILHLYERSSNRIGESLPQLAFSESAIRFSKVLGIIHLAGGKLDDDVLRLMVDGKPLPTTANVKAPRLNIHPTRALITTTLFRAFPSASAAEDLGVVDRAVILGGIASVLGDLGYHRKKAMVMRELIGIILPGLIQARIAGAAEMGIHPGAASTVHGTAANLAAFELGGGDMEAGLDQLLRGVGQIYGVVSWELPTIAKGTRIDAADDSDEAIISRIMRNTRFRAFGGQYLKMNVLRACIDLLEALPDHQGILSFSSDLLRTAGSGIAPGPKSLNASPAMSREEQLRLTTTIYKHIATGKKVGLTNLGAEYWDEFLVRGVDLELQPHSRTPVPHQPSELGSTTVSEAKERNPFIYNPFLRRPDATNDRLLVAGENAVFKVTLQNPYDVELEIESIRLEAEGVQFVSAIQRTVIGPYRTQILSVNGTPKEPGMLTVLGCFVRVKGCRERRFPIFTAPWTPKTETKIKNIGLGAADKDASALRPVTPGQKPPAPEVSPPTPTNLKVLVIQQQPIVVVKSTTLSQSALMVLEGERQRFSVTLQNLSQITPADLVLFSFQDSTQAPLQTALSNREASPAELHEYELILLRKQALSWKEGEQKPFIAPGGTASFDFEILGKPGLTNCSIQIDYCYLGKQASEVDEKFHTRQVVLPLTVTVNASVELARADILPLTGHVPQDIWPKHDGHAINADECCILLLDLRNSWPSALRVHLEIGNSQTIDEDILPGQTSRILFPVRRIYLDDPYASIPALDPSRQRQFVVSTGRVTADSERANRESFWYRESILKLFSGSWSTVAGPKKSGEIEFRGMRLGPRMIDAIRGDAASINISIDATNNHIVVDAFHQLTVSIRNRSKEEMNTILRIQPSLRNHEHVQALDLAKKLVWDGALQFKVPPVPPNAEVQVSLGVSALAKGEFDISASIEDAKLHDEKKEGGENEEKSQNRPRANTKTTMDAILGGKTRRIWYTREPCLLVAAFDDDDDDSDVEV